MINRIFYVLLMVLLISLLAACSSSGTTTPSETTAGKLSHSMKGYELYSWQEKNQWHFTLLTGTNRNKTLEEIISNANVVAEDEWVQIHVVGVDAIETVLSKLPQNEEVLWLARLRSEQTEQGDINIQLPPGQIIDAIKGQAGRCGLNFLVQQP
jgi:maltose-binding protein MalE